MSPSPDTILISATTEDSMDREDIIAEDIAHEEFEDAHLEAMYEDRFGVEDYEPSPYDGTYSEM